MDRKTNIIIAILVVVVIVVSWVLASHIANKPDWGQEAVVETIKPVYTIPSFSPAPAEIDVTPTPTPAPEEFPYPGIITGDGVRLRSTPDSYSGNVIAELSIGAKVTVLDRQKGWVKIAWNEQEGYIHHEYIRKEVQ